MSIRQHRIRDVVAKGRLARLLNDEPVSATGNTPHTAPRRFPPDARAVIHRPGRSVMTAGRANTCDWVLEFEPRSREFIEPLMGWTGGQDPLRHVRLSFPSREAAIAYARREGLPFTVHEPQEPRPSQCPAGRMPEPPEHAGPQDDPLFCFLWDRPHLALPDYEAPLLGPAWISAIPGDAVGQPA